MPAPKNLIHEASASTGTGNLTLAAVNGKVRFSDSTYGFGAGGTNVFDYFVSNRDAAQWEIGTGHMSDANTLVRDTVVLSSNSNNAVNFSAGNKDVTNDVPAASHIYVGSIYDSVNKQTIAIPASAMWPRATSGAGEGTYDSGANDVTIKTLDFDTATQEYAHFLVPMPKGWNEGTVTAQFYWTNTGGASTQTVRWSIAGRALGDDDAINGAFGTAQVVDDTWLAQNDMHISGETPAITIGNTPAENDLVLCEITRVVANDNMAGDALLIAVKLFIILAAAHDA